MIRCSSCNIENRDDAKFCINCGSSIYSYSVGEKSEDNCFGQPEKRLEDECFGIPHGSVIVGLIFGAFIIFVGLSILAGFNIESFIGPFIVIVIGLLIVIGSIYGLSRKKGKR
jgi:hypothetical protein